MLDCKTVVNPNLIKKLVKKNYSRIPIYHGDENNKLIIGILLVRSLIGLKINKNSKYTIADLIKKEKVRMKEPLYVKPDAKCELLMKYFKKGRHMAIVVTEPEPLVEEAEEIVNFICNKDN